MNTEVLLFPWTLSHPKHLKKWVESERQRRPEEHKDQKARGNWNSLKIHCYITEITGFVSVGKSNVSERRL